MKLTVVFLLLSMLSANALVYSQDLKIDFSKKSFTVGEVLATIEKNSEYRFLYRNDQINLDRTIKIDPSDKTIDGILTSVFNKTGVNFRTVENNLVILTPVVQQKRKPVSGKVTDETGQPLVGVTVTIKGSTRAVVTDRNGIYSIPLNENDKDLIFSFVGMKKQEIPIEGRSIINLVMEQESSALSEVIVIGYGTAKRKDYTGSVASVRMENSPVALLPNLNPLEALKGNVAGLNIGATNTAGGEPTMQIRGQNSINGSNTPLVVLDGVIYLGSISDINPNDIASYDILKDAVSNAAYGSRSANGIIAITTKKGKSGKPVITFNTSTGFQTWQNQPVMMKGKEWLTVVNARNQYAVGSTNWLQVGELANYNAGKETVWLDKVTRTGVTQDYQAAISGAAEKINYYLSTAYSNDKGIVVGDYFNRLSVFGKMNTNVTSWLEIGVDASFSKRDYSGFAANIASAEAMSPYGVMYRDDQGHLEKYPYTQSLTNPLWGINDGTASNTDIRNNFRLNAYALISIPWVKGLTFRSNLLNNLDKDQSGNFYNEKYYVKEGAGIERYSPTVVQGFLTSANGNIDNQTTKSYVLDNILNYKNEFGKHSIDVTAVATRDHQKYEDINGTGSDFSANGNTALDMWGLSKATVQKVALNATERSNVGYLGRLSYSYNDKYFLTSSYRRDGASVFGVNKKWGNFAAVGGAWKISSESFLKDFKPLNNLKLKLAWGQNGNQGAGIYSTLSTVLNRNISDNTPIAPYEFSNNQGIINYGLVQTTLGNSELGWETTESYNTGFESAWLKNRLFVDVDLYFSKTTNQIFARNIPVMTGFTTILTSLGEVDNHGIEVSVRSVNYQSKDWKWNTTLTYWMNRNKVVHLYGPDKTGKEQDDLANNLFIGKSLGAIYGYEQIGIVQDTNTYYKNATGAKSGDPKYKDQDGDGKITAADRRILGYTVPNFRLNMSNNVSYKNFELYVMLTGTFGGNGYYRRSNTTAYMTSGTGRFNDNMISKPYWTPDNKSNTYPSATFSGDGRFLGLQNQQFIRIQDVSLSYSLEQKWLKSANIKTLKVFVSAKNLGTFTRWVGGDPETGTTVGANTYPVPTTYSFGANISF
ncbi:MAG: TonB-dependent receptor [Bacteroidota bacterium]|nr:TonB-dependent receptor [Bacteroidota bacterium]